jgi:hypothetical protein
LRLILLTSKSVEPVTNRGAAMVLRSIVFTLILSSLLGCGSNSGNPNSSSTSQPPIPVTPALDGNWQLEASSQVSGQTYPLGGNLTTSGSTVSGILHFPNWSCFLVNNSIILDIPVSGTISSSGNLMLSSGSVSVQSQALTLSGVWSNGDLTSGTYKITGGCASGDRGTITGFPVPGFNGTYKGVFSSASGVQIATAITVTQTGPTSDGSFGLSGSVKFSGSPCFASGPIATSLIVGNFVQVQITTGNGLVLFQGTVDPTGKTITGQYSITGGSCAEDYGAGTLSLT